jgi:hypothetical protein
MKKFFLFVFLLGMSTLPLAADSNAEVAKTTVKTPKPPRLTVSQIIGNGAYLMLSDNSVWAIAPGDTLLSGAWISAAEITIQETQDPTYPYLLYNTLTQTSVRARKSSLDEVHQRIQSNEIRKQETIIQQKKTLKKTEELTK